MIVCRSLRAWKHTAQQAVVLIASTVLSRRTELGWLKSYVTKAGQLGNGGPPPDGGSLHHRRSDPGLLCSKETLASTERQAMLALTVGVVPVLASWRSGTCRIA